VWERSFFKCPLDVGKIKGGGEDHSHVSRNNRNTSATSATSEKCHQSLFVEPNMGRTQFQGSLTPPFCPVPHTFRKSATFRGCGFHLFGVRSWTIERSMSSHFAPETHCVEMIFFESTVDDEKRSIRVFQTLSCSAVAVPRADEQSRVTRRVLPSTKLCVGDRETV